MDELPLGLFGEKDQPDAAKAWEIYDRGRKFNNQLNLEETVRVNRNFVVGKQWEGVQSNGLPTPQFNILKRVVGFITASITTDNIKVNAEAFENTPNTGELAEPVRIVNEEFELLTKFNDVPGKVREWARNAATDGDGCMFTYWDEDVDLGRGVHGLPRTEILDNTRVFFGNPNDRDVQSQPYITIARREICRNVRKRSKEDGNGEWNSIRPDTEDNQAIDSAKYTDDKVTVLLTLWRDEESGEIWGYESTQAATVRKPWSLGIRRYPLVWLNWDYIQDSYHGQAMVTGLIPNQIFINKAWAMSMLSMMKTAFPKVVYNRHLVTKWDNRVGGAIAVDGGDINNVAKIIDPAPISPQVFEFIQAAIDQTQTALGATAVAMGDARPDNTSAIIALQRAASTPSELTKQNIYRGVEDQFYIYLEFMANFYGERVVDMEVPQETQEAMTLAGMPVQDTQALPFDFSVLKEQPMMLRLDAGASSYYSEIAAMQTLDNLLQLGHITPLQYLERIPNGYIPKRQALVAEKKREQMAAQGVAPPPGAPGMGAAPGAAGGSIASIVPGKPEIPTGAGNSAMQRKIVNDNSTAGVL